MCRGCFNQLFLRDEFHSGGIAGLLGKAAGMPTRRAFMAYSVAAASALPPVGTASAFAADDGADLILRGGTIRPLAGAPVASALAVKGGKVLAVGDESALSGLKTGETKIVDLAGRTLMPGLIDPHCHTLLASLIFELLDDVGYAKYPTREKLVAHLKQAAASTPNGQWVVGSNFDNLLQGGDLTRTELNAISTDHPIFVWYTNGHDACVNSEALRIAGIPDEVGELPGGGHFGRASDGKLNGMVYEESAMLKFAVHFLGKITPEVAAKAVTDFCRHMGSVGNTMLHEPGTIRSDWIEPFAKLSNTLACRTSASVMFDDMKGLTPWRSLGLGKGATVANSLFSLYGVKIVGDGSNQTETGAQTKPYLNSASRGSPNFDAARMKQMVAEVQALGLPVQIHCNGDYTIDIALDAIEAAYSGSTDYGVNRIEHSTMARPDQLLRMKTLNVQPSFLMNHRTLLRRRLSRPDLRPRARGLHGPRRGLRESRPAIHAAHRRALLAAGPARAHQHRGDAPLHHRQFRGRPGSGRFARRRDPRRDDRRGPPDRAGRPHRLAREGQGSGLHDPGKRSLQGEPGRDRRHQGQRDLGSGGTKIRGVISRAEAGALGTRAGVLNPALSPDLQPHDYANNASLDR